MIGSLIGTAISAAASIYGGMKASEAMDEAKAGLGFYRRKNQDWYERRYNEDATQRADAQAVLTRVEDDIRKRNRAAAGTQAVMGGTEESVAAAKAANNEALANAAANIAANGEARKDAIESQYLQTDANLMQSLTEIEKERAAAISQAIGGVAKTSGNIGSLIDQYASKS